MAESLAWWQARDELFNLANIIGEIKSAADAGCDPAQLLSALAAHERWREQLPSGWDSGVCFWAWEIEGLRQSVFHYTPPESHLSWNTAAYALCCIEGDIVEPTVALAVRDTSEGWTRGKLRQALCDALATYDRGFFLRELQYEFKQIEKSPVKQVGGGAKCISKNKRRRRTAPRKPAPLTPEQTEAMQLVGEHKGNVAAAAKAAGKSRQALGKLYCKALKKLGQTALPKPKTEPLPTDRRGQANLAD